MSCKWYETPTCYPVRHIELSSWSSYNFWTIFHVTIHDFCNLPVFNSSPPSAVYMRQWTVSTLVQVMACRLFGAKPLSAPMLAFCQLDYWKQISEKFEIGIRSLSLKKMHLKMSSARMGAILSRGRWVKVAIVATLVVKCAFPVWTNRVTAIIEWCITMHHQVSVSKHPICWKTSSIQQSAVQSL